MLGYGVEDLQKLFEIGVLGTIVLVLLISTIKGTTQATVWFGREILLPIKTHLIEHLDKTGKILEAIQRTNADEQGERHQMLQTLSEHTRSITRIDQNVAEIKMQSARFFQEQHDEIEKRNPEQ